MYTKLDAELPLPTRILLGWTGFVTAAWPLLLGGVIVLFVVSHVLFGRGAAGHRRRDGLVLRTPVIGPLYEIISVERFCRVLAALTTAGVPLPDGIEMSADSTNNTHFQARMAPVREALVRGGGISKPMTESGVIPTAALQMIRVGERTGSLAVQLHKSAAFFEREVTYRIKKATDLFQPTVIVLVGSLVGFVAIAQVSAMYSIFGQVNR
jgi:type IV pilus assembly protein PilC